MKSPMLVFACFTSSLLFLPIARVSADPMATFAATDQSFVTKAAQGGMTEVEAGKAAQEKGSSQDVKDFGAMMVKDHSANNDELAGIAKDKSMTVPDKLDSKHQAMIDKMNGMSGADFDKAYIKDQVQGHKDMLKLMHAEERSKIPELKNFATKTADTVQMHLTKAEEIQKSMMSSK